MSDSAHSARTLPLHYPVYVERGLLTAAGALVQQHAPAHRYAVISDETVARHHASALIAALPAERTRLFTIPAGESEKTRQRWSELTDALFAWEAGRDTTVIALGGGVIGDLAGFVAATFMRGVPVVQVPTTLLAMVDASVGGKTGVDTPSGKNLVGAFHDPSAVVMAIETLETLPPAPFRSGLAEVLKHGVIADAEYLALFERSLPSLAASGTSAPELPELVAGSVAIKARVVAEDAREGGLRHTLNFGHTIAHAVERLLDYRLLHGDAVAMGMVVEARIAESMGIAEAGTADAIAELVRGASLPVELPSSLAVADILAATRGDKKNRQGRVRYALPTRLGEMHRGGGTWSVEVPDSVVEAALKG